MKNTFQLVILILLVSSITYGQNISIDLILNSNKKNVEFQLAKMIEEIVAEKTSECLSFNVINTRDEGTSPYIIELWESDEFVNQYIFKNARKRKVEGKNGKETVRYTAAGINVRAIYKVLGRMTERESHSIIDLFLLDGRLDKEIEDDEVRKKWKMKMSDREDLSYFILDKYEAEINEKRKETQEDIKDLLSYQLVEMIAQSILPPARVTGIAEQKKDKVKKIKIEKCEEIDISQYGTFYFAIYTQEEKNGNKIYNQVGTCYFDDKDGVMGVRKGEKELLPLIKNGTPLYVGKHKSMDPHALSSEKTEKTKDVSFIFFYEKTHTYSEMDRLNLEFLYQSSFLGFKNIRVIADDKITKSINETTSQSIHTYDPNKEDDLSIEPGDIKSNTTIFVSVPNPKKVELKSDFLKGDDYDPDAEYIIAKAEYHVDDTKYESWNQYKTFNNKIGMYYTNLSTSLSEIKAPLLDTNIKIIGIAEEKKGKVKKVYVSSTTPLDEGDTYKVYLKERITKKTKEFAKLKIDEIVNKYVAIADVKKGDKVIGPYTDGSKPIYTKKSEGGGLFGKVLSLAGESDGNGGKISYIKGRNSRI